MTEDPSKRESIDVPVKPVDVDHLRRKLAAVATLSRYLVEHLDDLASLAYEKAVGERDGGAGAKGGGYLTDTGDRRAKVALARLDAGIVSYEKALGDAIKVVTSGPGADVTLRGTMLGFGGTGVHPADEHARLLKKQSVRRERGDFTPTKVEAQPRPNDNRRKKGKR